MSDDAEDDTRQKGREGHEVQKRNLPPEQQRRRRAEEREENGPWSLALMGASRRRHGRARETKRLRAHGRCPFTAGSAVERSRPLRDEARPPGLRWRPHHARAPPPPRGAEVGGHQVVDGGGQPLSFARNGVVVLVEVADDVDSPVPASCP